MMGILKTIFKTALTWDKQYVIRYDSAIIARGAILELCKSHGFQAYLIARGREPVTIDENTDLSGEFLSCFEIDLVRRTRIFFVGFALEPTVLSEEVRLGRLDREVYHKNFRWDLMGDLFRGHYASSFELLEELLKKIDCLEERQRSYHAGR